MDGLLQRFKPAPLADSLSTSSVVLQRRPSNELRLDDLLPSVPAQAPPHALPATAPALPRELPATAAAPASVQVPVPPRTLPRPQTIIPPAERELIQPSQLQRPRHEAPRYIPSPVVEGDEIEIPPAPKSAPTPGKSAGARRESLIPRFGRYQPSRETPHKRDENSALSANTRHAPGALSSGKEKTWLREVSKTAARRETAPTSGAALSTPGRSLATPGRSYARAVSMTPSAPPGLMDSGIPSAPSRRYSIAPPSHYRSSGSSSKRRPNSTRF